MSLAPDETRSPAPKTLAVMQPYAFPYLGYFSLVEASDVFVFYDDVTFIQQGWVNRNRILVNGAPHRFTIPLSNASSNELIANVGVHQLDRFRTKFLRQLEQSYKKSPFRDVGLSYVDHVLSADGSSIADIAVRSVERVYEILSEGRTFHRSSVFSPESRGIGRADRLVEVARKASCARYVNPIGGDTLYEKPYFSERGVELLFLKPRLNEYRQPGAPEFVPGLSIIDALMNNPLEKLKALMSAYEIA